MDFKVVFRDSMLEDLERIIGFIAVRDPEAAKKLGEMIIRTGERLSFFPERYPRVRQRPGIRRYIVMQHFKVFYRIQYESKTVEILCCWDGRRQSDPSFHGE
jgi:toxin ParE1/3/4